MASDRRLKTEMRLSGSSPRFRHLIPSTRLWLVTAIGVSIALSVGCGDGPTDPVPAAPGSIAAVSATALGGTVGQPVTTLPSVIVRDQNGGPMFGVRVTFAVTEGGGVITGGTAFTDANGIATVGSWTLGPTAGANTLTATAGSLSPVTFVATAQSGPPTALAKSAGDAQTGPVAAVLPIAPAVIVTDALGNPVAGATVVFEVAGGGGSITGGTVITNGTGIAAVGSWTLGAVPGPNTLDATFGELTVTFTATAVAGAPASIIKQAGEDQTATVGEAVPVAPSVRVTDAQGNPVPNVAVTFEIGSGGGSLTGATQTTDANGIATVGSWTLGTNVGVNTLTATVGSLTATFTATATTGDPAILVKLAGDLQSDTVGTAVGVDPTVRLTDAHGNPVAGVSVVFAVASGGGSVTGGAPLTDADGVATVGSWTLGTTAGSNTLTATAGTISVTFTATGTAAAPSSMVKHTGDAQTATVGTAVATAPAVRITDSYGNPVPGVAVTFAVAAGGGSVTPGEQETDADGVATVTSWTLGTTAGENTLGATAGSLTVDFTATGVADAPVNIVEHAGDDQDATVGTAVAVDPAVRITDVHGNPVPNVPVTFAVASGGGSVTGASQSTDANGVATIESWTLGSAPGENTLTATAGLLEVTFTATALVGPAANVVKQAGDGLSATVNTALGTAPTVFVTDALGNPVPGVTVTFAVAPGSGSLTGEEQVTDADGLAPVGSWTLGTTAGENTLTATVDGVVATFTATGVADDPDDLLRISDEDQSAPAGGVVSAPPSVRVVDQYGNGVPGITVTFTVTAGNGSVNGETMVEIQTGVDGIATVGSWTLDAAPGTNELTAQVGLLPSVVFTATGT